MHGGLTGMTPDVARELMPEADRVLLVTESGEAVTLGALARQARCFSESLPAEPHLVNLCQDRHAFMVTMLAAVIGGRTTLVPSDRTPYNLGMLASRFPGLSAITDTVSGAKQPGNYGFPVHEFRLPGNGLAGYEERLPDFDGDAARIVMFTSGSTGVPVPHRNRPDFFVQGAVGNATSVLAGLDAPASIVATVPPFHMYGFELSVWLPLLAGATVFAGMPFYPADIVEALAAMPAPRILVSTPVHLRVLMESDVTGIDCARVFSATAPLGEALARRIEERFQCEAREIYGTTETGSVGWRRTAREEFFTVIPGMRIQRSPDGCHVSASHIDPPIALNDRLEPDGAERFRIAGRSNDIVNIAGKRESLSGLNTVLSSLDGVVDGAFLAPGDEATGRVGRMVAFVVAPGLAAEDIRTGLRDKLDPAFIPRRIVFVESLPRNAAGKLPASEFARFAREHLDEPEAE